MDYIDIYDNNNHKKQMEVVSIFRLDNQEYNYIIYRELDKSRTYLAKFKDNVEELNTDISEHELKLCETILNEVIK